MPLLRYLALMAGSLAFIGLSASPEALRRPPAQSDLDAFMERVLARRDENWKKLQQYVLDERESVELLGPGRVRLYGFSREYTWYIRDGYFVRSPLRFEGVALNDADRRTYEEQFIAREKRRETERARKAENAAEPDAAADEPDDVDGLLRATREPRFVSAAYFLKFVFERGQYALVGREPLLGRQVLRVEYYPTRLFREDDDEKEKRRGRAKRRDPEKDGDDRDARIDRQMNKVALVTLWIDPASHQILQYTFDNVGLDFLPARWLVRVDDLHATMKMAEAFPGVWLPDLIELRVAITLANGTFEAQQTHRYANYREAAVTVRVK